MVLKIERNELFEILVQLNLNPLDFLEKNDIKLFSYFPYQQLIITLATG